MVRATTPTRRPAWGAAIGASAASQSFNRRVTLSAAAAGGICSRPRHPSINNLPAARLSLPGVVSRSRGRAKRACSCSPTTHPGSFRCALHRGPSPVSSGRHHARRSATANSLVRTALLEGGDHVRRALAALVRHSSHHQRRRASFCALPSRLSAMSTAAAGPSPSAPL